jgi:hypothetical protein
LGRLADEAKPNGSARYVVVRYPVRENRRNSADKHTNNLPNNLVPHGICRDASAFRSRSRGAILALHGNELGGGPDRPITQVFCDELLTEYHRLASWIVEPTFLENSTRTTNEHC